MDADQTIFVHLIAMDLKTLNEAMERFNLSKIMGIDDLVNTVNNGRDISRKKQRFIDNLNRQFDYYSADVPKEFADRCPQVMKRTLDRLLSYVEELTFDNPIQYHSEHLKLIDIEQISHFFHDNSAGAMRIIELLKFGKPELSLPALKDHYNLAFEKIYKGTYYQLKDMFKDAIGNETESHKLHDALEDILAFETTYECKGACNSDFRRIRNLFAHPDRIDRYDHYHLNITPDISKDIDANELQNLTSIMVMKMAIVLMLMRVVIDFKLYSLIFKDGCSQGNKGALRSEK